MKKKLLTLFLICASFFSAKANFIDLTDSLGDVKIEQEKIIYRKKVLGNIKTLKVEAQNQTSNNYRFQIFGKKGSLIAEYEMEVVDKQKKNQDDIITAHLKTTRDNIIHNGNNFLDFHQKASNRQKDDILQLEKVIKYLLTYNYL
ncbi:MAG TPA: hypothetical protein VFM79_08500 [Pelobium sp.]|nr:hypothetical protein [Pelobium sp.]